MCVYMIELKYHLRSVDKDMVFEEEKITIVKGLTKL